MRQTPMPFSLHFEFLHTSVHLNHLKSYVVGNFLTYHLGMPQRCAQKKVHLDMEYQLQEEQKFREVQV